MRAGGVAGARRSAQWRREEAPQEAFPACCPRCSGALVRNHEELFCMVHGTVWTPVYARDRVDGEDAEGPKEGKLRRSRSTSRVGNARCPQCGEVRSAAGLTVHMRHWCPRRPQEVGS